MKVSSGIFYLFARFRSAGNCSKNILPLIWIGGYDIICNLLVGLNQTFYEEIGTPMSF